MAIHCLFLRCFDGISSAGSTMFTKKIMAAAEVLRWILAEQSWGAQGCPFQGVPRACAAMFVRSSYTFLKKVAKEWI